MARAISPVVGVVLLAAVTLLTASAVGFLAMDRTALPSGRPAAAPLVLSGSADAGTGRVELVHVSGPPVDVRRVRVRITVEGTPLRHQPPVPFAGAPGFRGAPSGPFNAAADPGWEVGERAGLRLAGTNDPALSVGGAVTVELFRDDRPLASVSLTAR